MDLNLLAIFTFLLSLVAGVVLICRRVPRGGGGESPVCGGCGAVAAGQVEAFVCAACGRDVRTCGLAVPGANPRLALMRRLSVFSGFLVLVAGVVAVVTEKVPGSQARRATDVLLNVRSDAIAQIVLRDVYWTGGGTLDGDIYLRDGRVVSLEMTYPAKRCRLTDAAGKVVGEGIPYDEALRQWVTLTGVGTWEESVWPAVLGGTIDEMRDGSAGVVRHTSVTGVTSGISYASGTSPLLCLWATVFSIGWLLGVAWILRRGRPVVARAPTEPAAARHDTGARA